MRRLGATKIQIGIQNLDNEILMKNKRGHGIEEIHSAFKLLRLAGFKIQAHWMPNLYSSTVKKDIGNYKKLWRNNSKGLHPDEIKIYPTSVIKGTKLFELCERGEYKPFTLKQLKAVLKQALIDTPRYCRISRVIRDIPQQEIEAGSKVTNLRQIIHQEMEKTGQKCECIRCREIRDKDYSMSQLSKEQIIYKTNSSTEYFLSFKTPEDNIVGFLRLCLPNAKLNQNHFISELKDSAIIREIHIYGQSREIGDRSGIAPQHKGLGKRLIDWAQIITIKNDLHKLSVISAVGTRKYYEKRGFEKGLLYMHKNLVQGQQL
jgi:elongator complex protein 3